MARTIRIFLSSPSDVMAEQETVIALAAEINDVIAFLVPSLDVKLDVLRYQDDVYPDMGKPQDIVDRQIPQDFDIHLGIMWMRCGTPTTSAPSGTIHEFRQAIARRDETGRPIIMFYFSDAHPPAMPRTQSDIAQLGEVLKFREELQQIGLTMSYPDQAAFRDRVRGGLLRAIADLLKHPAVTAETRIERALPPRVVELAQLYDEVREKQDASGSRTRKMTEIFGEMVAEGPAAIEVLPRLKTNPSAGMRLAGIAALKAFPHESELDWLAERLDPAIEKPFVGYQAAMSLTQAVRSLPRSADSRLRSALDRAMMLARRNPHDPPRINVLEQAQRELAIKSRRELP